MYSRINNMLSNINADHDIYNKGHVESNKNLAINKLYNLALMLKEFADNEHPYIEDNVPEDKILRAKRFFTERVNAIIPFIDSLALAETNADVVRIMDDFSDTAGPSIFGWIYSNKSNLPWIANSSFYNSELVNNSQSYMTHETESNRAMDGLFAKIARDITSGHKSLNIYSNDIDRLHLNATSVYENGLVHYHARVKPVFNANNSISFNYYTFREAPESYNYASHLPIDNFDKVITGDSSGVRISNAFDIGIISSRFLGYFEDNFKSSYFRTNTHVSRGGLMIVLTPRFFLDADRLKFFCGYLDNIQFYMDNNFAKTGFVALVGTRRNRVEYDNAQIYQKMIELLNATPQSEHAKYNITLMQPERILFRSAVPDKNDIVKALEHNADFLSKNNKPVNKAIGIDYVEPEQRNMLPFSPSQLGVILVAGKINGVITQPDGCKHVIKGSVYKTVNQTSIVNENGEHVETTVTGNGTTVTMLTANGEFKTLR